jgi:deazaflavin-dependent oxidoreductase (nitroreductase family)
MRRRIRALGRVQRVVYRATGGRVGGRVWGLSILLLTTTGRKTGKVRTTPLCFYPDGDNLVVVASNGGLEWFPSWWLNLLEHPQAAVQVGGRTMPVVARPAGPEERARLWSEITAIAPGYLEYEKRAPREIPLAVLRPADAG